MDYRRIVWLASYPKSGNTWVRAFLDAYYLGDVDINDLVCSVTDSLATRNLTGDGTDPTTYPIDIQQLTRPMALLRLVQQWDKNSQGDVPLFVKSHSAHLITNGIEWLPLQLTQAVIHIVRDPRGVLPSFAQHMGLDYDKGIDRMDLDLNMLNSKGEMTMAEFLSSWEKHTRSYVSADTHNVRTFRYEDMQFDPIGTFSAMLTHAGVTPDRERVIAALAAVDLDRLAKQEDDNGFREASKKADGRFFGQKHAPLTPMQRTRIEKRFGRLMKRLDYGNQYLRGIAN